jgi:hypothetical protein
METSLNRVVGEFTSKPLAAANGMRRIFGDSNPEAFAKAAAPILRSDVDHPGKQYLLTLLLMNDLIFRLLADASVFTVEEAVTISSSLVKIQPLIDLKMRELFDCQNGGDELIRRLGFDAAIRLLEIMASIPEDWRMASMFFQLLGHSNQKIRSKAALLSGRIKKNCKWVEARLTDSDLRVRANAVESLWGVELPGVRELLWAAVQNPDNRTAGNALLGLHHLGEAASIPLIVELLSHADPKFRLTGVWVMGETGDPQFKPLLARIISDPDPHIRSAVFRALAKLKRSTKTAH